MTLNDFRIGWRTLVQEPAYSLVVVLGLATGFATALLLLGFVRYSWDYNAQVPDVDNVYVVKQRHNIGPRPLWYDLAPMLVHAAALKTPGVAGAAEFLPTLENGLTVKIDGRLHPLRTLTVTPGFSAMLGVQAIQGNLALALQQPDALVLTQARAVSLFGTSNVVGRTVQAEGKLLRVAAIVGTPPPNTTVPYDSLLGVHSVLTEPELRDEMLTGSRGWWGKHLIRSQNGASVTAVTAALQHAVDNAAGIQNISADMRARLGTRKVMDVELTPLRHAYFDRHIEPHFISAPGERADPMVIAALGAIALLILALAAVNYVNLATVRVLQRQREVAMRKVLGAGVRDIAVQMLTESLLVAMLAAAIGLLLVWLALPVFSELVNRQLTGMLSATNVAAAVILALVLGMGSALYPAWIAIRVRPGQVLAGKPNTESHRGMQLRRLLTVLQVATALALASVTLAVAWQTEYALRADPGFDAAPLVVVDLPAQVRWDDKARAFASALAAQSGVAGVAVSNEAGVGRSSTMLMLRDFKRPDGTSVSMQLKAVSANFFEQYRLAPQAGRLFAAGTDTEEDPVPVVLNAMAARELGFATVQSAVGKTVLLRNYDGAIVPKRVVGIAPDLRFQSLREPPRAVAYELSTAGNALSVRASGSVLEVERAVRALWPGYFPNAIVQVNHARTGLALNYAEDARMVKLLGVATCIALAIAAFGTYVLSAHTVQRRAREIVLRKLYGAGRLDIARLVVREIGTLTLVSAAIGLPIAAVAIERYLATYVERAPIGYWTLLLALVCTMLIALVAVARHAGMAMRMKPAEALRG